MNPEETGKKEKQTEFFVEKDVLGLEKPHSNATNPKAKPNRIFIGLGIIILIAIVYWVFFKH